MQLVEFLPLPYHVKEELTEKPRLLPEAVEFLTYWEPDAHGQPTPGSGCWWARLESTVSDEVLRALQEQADLIYNDGTPQAGYPWTAGLAFGHNNGQLAVQLPAGWYTRSLFGAGILYQLGHQPYGLPYGRQAIAA